MMINKNIGFEKQNKKTFTSVFLPLPLLDGLFVLWLDDTFIIVTAREVVIMSSTENSSPRTKDF